MYIYVYIQMHMYVCMYVCMMYVFMHACMHACMHVFMYVYIYRHVSMCTYYDINVCVFMWCLNRIDRTWRRKLDFHDGCSCFSFRNFSVWDRAAYELWWDRQLQTVSKVGLTDHGVRDPCNGNIFICLLVDDMGPEIGTHPPAGLSTKTLPKFQRICTGILTQLP